MIQTIIALVLVTLAAVWLLRRVLQTFQAFNSGKADRMQCGGCSRNPANRQGSPVRIGIAGKRPNDSSSPHRPS